MPNPENTFIPPSDLEANIFHPIPADELSANITENITGCTDSEASNYNPEATQYDESCEYVKNIKLNKVLYDQKQFREEIYTEFSELSVQDYSVKDFFSMYNKLYYDIPIKGFFSHQTILEKSLNYIGGYTHPRSLDIDNLYDELQKALERFYSIEEEHAVIKNNALIEVKQGFDLVPNRALSEYYVIQSYRKRKITANIPQLVINRMRELRGLPSNAEFIIQLSQDALDLIPDGPNINQPSDLEFTTLQVNVDVESITEKINLIDMYGSGINGMGNNYNQQNQTDLFIF